MVINVMRLVRGVLWVGILSMAAMIVYDLVYSGNVVLYGLFALLVAIIVLASCVLSETRKLQREAGGVKEEGINLLKKSETTLKVIMVFGIASIIIIPIMAFFDTFLDTSALPLGQIAFIMAFSIKLFLQMKAAVKTLN